jgi:hypothetical protein
MNAGDQKDLALAGSSVAERPADPALEAEALRLQACRVIIDTVGQRHPIFAIHPIAWNRNSRKFKSSILHSPARIGLKPRPGAFTSCIQGMYQAVTCMILRRDE